MVTSKSRQVVTETHSSLPATLCHQFGITESVIAERLRFLQLGHAEEQRAEELHSQVIEPHLNGVVDLFYDRLFAYPQAAAILQNYPDIGALKATQKEYLKSLGRNFGALAYFESRLQVGITHLNVGIGLPLYQYAFFALQKLLLERIPPAAPNAPALTMVLLKIATLDMSLAIEAYESREKFDFGRRILALTRKQASLQKLADTDTLTGVLRRKPILDLVKEKLALSSDDQPVYVLLADLDYFKKVNDTYGHLVGDFVLKDTVDRIRATVRRINPVGRYGGEEFLILLSEANLEQATSIAERVRERIASEPIQADEHTIPITLSIGIGAASSRDGLTELIARADKALYNAKRSGRNRVEYYAGSTA